MIHTVIAAGVGYVVGAFTPAVGREIKSWFVKESKAVAPVVSADVAKVETEVKAKL